VNGLPAEASEGHHPGRVVVELEQAADAFGGLCRDRPEALIELLDPNVSWVEQLGARTAQTLLGSDAVARFLRGRVESGSRIELTGMVKTGRTQLEVGYTEPWWLDRQGMGARLAYYLLGDARQTVTVAGSILLIESLTSYLAARSSEIPDQAEGDLISLLRR
jgi:hypothetical protein